VPRRSRLLPALLVGLAVAAATGLAFGSVVVGATLGGAAAAALWFEARARR
jgi:hypothetical protein